MFALAFQASSDGLTLRELVTDIPHDLTALLVYLMLGLFVLFVWWGSKPEMIERYGAHYAEEPDAAGAADEHDDAPRAPAPRADEETTPPAARPVPSAARRRRRGADPARIEWMG